MFGRVREWIRGHPKWSIAIGVVALLVLYLALKPTPKTYEYVTQAIDRGDAQSAGGCGGAGHVG